MAPEVFRVPSKTTPEAYKMGDVPKSGFYATSADCWAVGVMAYELLAGRLPFPATAVGLCVNYWYGCSEIGTVVGLRGFALALFQRRAGHSCRPLPLLLHPFQSRLHLRTFACCAQAQGMTVVQRILDGRLFYPAPAISHAARDFIQSCLEPHPGDRPTAAEALQQPWLAGYQPQVRARHAWQARAKRLCPAMHVYGMNVRKIMQRPASVSELAIAASIPEHNY
jgi:serine/threonine protein kinase